MNTLFYKVFHNKNIFDNIIKFLSYEVEEDYDKLVIENKSSCKWLIENGYRKLLKYKIMKNHYLKLDNNAFDKLLLNYKDDDSNYQELLYEEKDDEYYQIEIKDQEKLEKEKQELKKLKKLKEQQDKANGIRKTTKNDQEVEMEIKFSKYKQDIVSNSSAIKDELEIILAYFQNERDPLFYDSFLNKFRYYIKFDVENTIVQSAIQSNNQYALQSICKKFKYTPNYSNFYQSLYFKKFNISKWIIINNNLVNGSSSSNSNSSKTAITTKRIWKSFLIILHNSSKEVGSNGVIDKKLFEEYLAFLNFLVLDCTSFLKVPELLEFKKSISIDLFRYCPINMDITLEELLKSCILFNYLSLYQANAANNSSNNNYFNFLTLKQINGFNFSRSELDTPLSIFDSTNTKVKRLLDLYYFIGSGKSYQMMEYNNNVNNNNNNSVNRNSPINTQQPQQSLTTLVPLTPLIQLNSNNNNNGDQSLPSLSPSPSPTPTPLQSQSPPIMSQQHLQQQLLQRQQQGQLFQQDYRSLFFYCKYGTTVYNGFTSLYLQFGLSSIWCIESLKHGNHELLCQIINRIKFTRQINPTVYFIESINEFRKSITKTTSSSSAPTTSAATTTTTTTTTMGNTQQQEQEQTSLLFKNCNNSAQYSLKHKKQFINRVLETQVINPWVLFCLVVENDNIDLIKYAYDKLKINSFCIGYKGSSRPSAPKKLKTDTPSQSNEAAAAATTTTTTPNDEIPQDIPESFSKYYNNIYSYVQSITTLEFIYNCKFKQDKAELDLEIFQKKSSNNQQQLLKRCEQLIKDNNLISTSIDSEVDIKDLKNIIHIMENPDIYSIEADQDQHIQNDNNGSETMNIDNNNGEIQQSQQQEEDFYKFKKPISLIYFKKSINATDLKNFVNVIDKYPGKPKFKISITNPNSIISYNVYDLELFFVILSRFRRFEISRKDEYLMLYVTGYGRVDRGHFDDFSSLDLVLNLVFKIGDLRFIQQYLQRLASIKNDDRKQSFINIFVNRMIKYSIYFNNINILKFLVFTFPDQLTTTFNDWSVIKQCLKFNYLNLIDFFYDNYLISVDDQLKKIKPIGYQDKNNLKYFLFKSPSISTFLYIKFLIKLNERQQLEQQEKDKQDQE